MTIRLLIVDDHAVVREGLVRLLAAQPGLEVAGEAAGAADAVGLASILEPDVVLLDIALVDDSGLDLIEPLHKAHPEVNVLMLSMHAEPEFATVAIERGAMGLVSKAATVQELVRAIEAANRGEVLPPEGALSAREREILALIGEGATNVEIARRLSIRPKTVEAHGQRMMAKLGIYTRAGLVAYACRTFSQQDLA
ncbi:response regulator transcription factor [Candidatus Bipolaricaulota bacterium]|nr:response regulator transcription factor [Candidatus Bipolaricaulota bacterium]